MGNHEFCDVCGKSIFHKEGDCDPKQILKESPKKALEYLLREMDYIREVSGGDTKEGKNKSTRDLVNDLAWKARTNDHAEKIAYHLNKILEHR